jgi:hypothetical protein
MAEVLSPEGAGKVATAKTADDINDLFKEIDVEEAKSEKKEIKEPKETKTPKEDSDESDDDLELSEPEEDEEKLDLSKEDDLEIEAPPRKKEILKKYPELFKDYPFLEKMMYRDREMMQLFGSFDDAKELAEKADVFNSFEQQLLAGDTKEILKEVKATDEKAFNIIVDEYLPTLAAVDREAYFHVVGNLNKRLIMEMVEEANSTGNEDLKQAALLVNQFVFGKSKFEAPTRRSPAKVENEAKNEVEQERLALVKERFETSRDELQTKVDNTLRATISDYIDPRGTMSPYVKKNAIADAMKILQNSIAADPTVPKNLDNLWRAAFNNKFSKETLNRIQSFYLSKAKGNLKNAILKARVEALKDAAPREVRGRETDDEEESPRQQRRTIPTGRPSQSKGKSNGPQKGESVTDFFMRD